MKISLNWIKEFVNCDNTAEEIAEFLTDTGLEVGGLEKFESIQGGLKGIVIGEVISCEQHPNADRLKLTKVNVGNGNPLSIVCGAQNVKKGLKVAVAVSGTTLYPIKGEPFKIKESKIRGEFSQGMICAEDEMGIGDSHDGIMELDEFAVPGEHFSSFLNIYQDDVLDIDLTPNRTDAMAHLGVARDLVAALNVQNSQNLVLNRNYETQVTENLGSGQISVEVKNSEACPRYAGIEIKNLKVGDSPDFIKNKLRAIGLTPINNIVDVTNYVLHELGNPLHAFDADQIQGNKVVVQTLNKGTKFTTLDDKIRDLDDHDLMICNGKEGMCIAGVFGGKQSGVTKNTTHVFLESAYFDPTWIRKTAKRHGLNTDASFRFERGVDPNMVITALKRAASLIVEVGGGEICSEIVDIYNLPVKDNLIHFRVNEFCKFSGLDLNIEVIKKILNDLEIEIIKEEKGTLELSVPPFRRDVIREIDVIEEVMRIYGFNQVPIPEKLNASISFSKGLDKDLFYDGVVEQLNASGFSESMSNSLSSEDDYKKWNLMEVESLVKVLNPLSNELNVMRKTHVFNALDVVRRNLNHKVHDIRFFEKGAIYSDLKEGVFDEKQRLSLTAVESEILPQGWIKGERSQLWFYMKGMLNGLLTFAKVPVELLTFQETEDPLMGFSASWCLNTKVLFNMGLVKPELLEAFEIDKNVIHASVDWEFLAEISSKSKISFEELPKYPTVKRDLSLLINSNVTFLEIKKLCFASEKKLLKNVDLFDVYQGQGIPGNKKSYAITLSFLDSESTLTDKKVDKAVKSILYRLEKELQVVLR